VDGNESAAPTSLPVGDGNATQGPPADVRTFLIADVRGYTRYTQEHGDELAGELAARFGDRVTGKTPPGAGLGDEMQGAVVARVVSVPSNLIP
jgi:class 3 adenylate cyclase